MKMHKPVLCKADKVRGIKQFNVFFHYKFKSERFSEDKTKTVGAYVYIYKTNRFRKMWLQESNSLDTESIRKLKPKEEN